MVSSLNICEATFLSFLEPTLFTTTSTSSSPSAMPLLAPGNTSWSSPPPVHEKNLKREPLTLLCDPIRRVATQPDPNSTGFASNSHIAAKMHNTGRLNDC